MDWHFSSDNEHISFQDPHYVFFIVEDKFYLKSKQPNMPLG